MFFFPGLPAIQRAAPRVPALDTYSSPRAPASSKATGLAQGPQGRARQTGPGATAQVQGHTGEADGRTKKCRSTGRCGLQPENKL